MERCVVVGIDPSFSGTALCWGPDPERVETVRFGSKSRGTDVKDRVDRIEILVDKVNRRIKDIEPSLIIMEGYSYASNDAKSKWSAEYGGVLRWHLVEHCPVLECAPNTLKKMATGVGKGQKQFVMAHVQKRWGKIFNSDDECDAYVMWRIALVIAGICEAETQAQRDAVATVLGDRKLNLVGGTVAPDDEIPF